MPRFKMILLAGALTGMLIPPLFMVRADSGPAVTEGSVVLIEFTITVPESRIVIPNNVSQFTPGQHELLPNLEKELTGMRKGEAKRVDLSSDEAFGPYDETKKGVISAESLPPDTQPGTVLTTEDGIPFVVIEISGPVASVDFNHPLAGKHLIIDVRILSVEAPDEPHGRRLGGLEAQQEFSI